MRYQVIFCQGGYSAVDFETDDYSQAQEMRVHLTAQMHEAGERDFTYIIKDTKLEELEKKKGYRYYKELARENAIAYQKYASENSMSYEDIVKAQTFFTLVGKRYGLLKEFRENGII